MVEGPGCKLKGIRIKAKLKGQKVVSVRGNAVDKQVKKRDGPQESTFHQLIGRTLDDVQSLGKELFLYFGDLCLRLHFLMAGQAFINNERVNEEGGGKAKTAVLEVQMSSDLLTLRNSSALIRPSAPCKEKYTELCDLDICSSAFNFTRAVTLVMAQTDRQVCDVLLDQAILPGVGNIIKNEALFDSGIKPSSKISELNKEHVSFLIKMTRDFTSIFYMCRRDGKPLHPYYKIYGKRRCGQCEGKVTICRQGDDSERMTYFCETCQTNDLKHRKLPQKNSLLGWVKTGYQSPEKPVDWSCTACTLINPGTKSTCSVCSTPRLQSANQSSNTRETTKISQNEKSLAELSPFGNPRGKKRPLQTAKGSNQSQTKVRKTESSSDPKSVVPNQRGVRNTQVQKSQTQGQSSQTQVQKSEVPTNETPNKIPTCSTHKRKCLMKEVRKEGNNLGRWFFSCVVRGCKFFEWADEKFPLCPGHGKPCTIRTVLKIGPNNGRRFFACKLPKNKQCKFFEWAFGYDEQ